MMRTFTRLNLFALTRNCISKPVTELSLMCLRRYCKV